MATIYLLEDNPVLSKVVAKHLVKAGYETKIFTRGDEMMDALSNTKPDLAICDIMVPGITGLDIARHIKTTAGLSNTPVMIMTAMTDSKYRVEAEKIGVDQYIVKNQMVLSQLVEDIKGHIGGYAL